MTDDDRDYLREAWEYFNGERTAPPSIEHVTAAMQMVETLAAQVQEFRVMCDLRDDIITQLVTGPGPIDVVNVTPDKPDWRH